MVAAREPILPITTPNEVKNTSLLSHLSLPENFSASALKTTKVALVAILHVGAAAVAYTQPGTYLCILFVAVPISVAMLTLGAQKIANKELLAKVIVVGALVFSPLVVGGAASFAFTMTHWAVWYIAAAKVKLVLMCSTVGIGIIGFGGPSCRELATGAYELLSSKTASDRAAKTIEVIGKSGPDKTNSWRIIRAMINVWDSVFLAAHIITPKLFEEVPICYRICTNKMMSHAVRFGSEAALDQLFHSLEKNIEQIATYQSLINAIEADAVHNQSQTITLKRKIGKSAAEINTFLKNLDEEITKECADKFVHILAKLDSEVLTSRRSLLVSPLKIPEWLANALSTQCEKDAGMITNEDTVSQFTIVFNKVKTSDTKQDAEEIEKEFIRIKKRVLELTQKYQCWKQLMSNPTIKSRCQTHFNLINSEHINQSNHIAMGIIDPNNNLTKLHDLIQKKKRSFQNNEEEPNEPTPAMDALYDYYTSASDFQSLCRLLGLDQSDFGGIPDALAAIGLVTENDLQEKTGIKKDTDSREGMNKINAYIINPPAKDTRSKIYEWLSNTDPLEAIQKHEWSKYTFRVITGACVIAPALIYPYVGIAFAAIGVAHVALLKIKKYREWARKGYEISHFHPGLNIARDFVERRNFLHLTRESRSNMEIFSRSSLFGRCRILAMETGLSFLVSILSIGRYPHTINVGIPYQSFALGREIGEFAQAQIRRRLLAS